MARPVVPPRTIEQLVDHMFDQVFSDAERGELLEWIRRWELENPSVDAAHRVTGWIDVAYAFQVRRTHPARDDATEDALDADTASVLAEAPE